MSMLIAAVAIVLAIAGCSEKSPLFVSEGSAYSADTIGSVFDSAPDSDALGAPVSDAATLRQQALVALRAQGGEAAVAADVLTRTFAASAAGVPVLVEAATYDGTDALVVVEVIGPKGGDLRDLRVWVIGTDGQVLYSGTR
jgi:hypothetical protein